VIAIYASNDASAATAKTSMEDLNPKRMVGGYLRGVSNWIAKMAL